MVFNCPSCPRSRESLSMLHMHCMVAHPKQIFTCPWCTVPFGSLQALQKHGGNCRKLEQREVKAPREGEIDDFSFISMNARCATANLLRTRKQSNTTKWSIWISLTFATCAKWIFRRVAIWTFITLSVARIRLSRAQHRRRLRRSMAPAAAR